MFTIMFTIMLTSKLDNQHFLGNCTGGPAMIISNIQCKCKFAVVYTAAARAARAVRAVKGSEGPTVKHKVNIGAVNNR